MTPHYFAYGAPSDRAFAPDRARLIGPAHLADVELAYAGDPPALCLRQRLGQAVSGMLVEAEPDAGAEACTAILPDGAAAPAWTLHALPDRAHVCTKPTAPAHLAAQAWRRAHGLDHTMLDQAAAGTTPSPAVPAVFVYGTLLPGELRGGVLASLGLAAPMQPAAVRGHLYHLGDHPGMVLDARAGRVLGEIATPADMAKTLLELDEIEEAFPRGQPGGTYRRTLIEVAPPAGPPVLAWTYVLDTPGPGASPLIPHGSWRARGG
jgi:gamma-glutamylcyclotransferase (GGCT)/AIG2-like uncharacterized protein YtfP